MIETVDPFRQQEVENAQKALADVATLHVKLLQNLVSVCPLEAEAEEAYLYSSRKRVWQKEAELVAVDPKRDGSGDPLTPFGW